MWHFAIDAGVDVGVKHLDNGIVNVSDTGIPS